MSDMAYSEGLEAESALSEVLVRRLLPGARLGRGRRTPAGLAVGLAASVPLSYCERAPYEHSRCRQLPAQGLS
jgi:hypothetical protein